MQKSFFVQGKAYRRPGWKPGYFFRVDQYDDIIRVTELAGCSRRARLNMSDMKATDYEVYEPAVEKIARLEAQLQELVYAAAKAQEDATRKYESLWRSTTGPAHLKALGIASDL